MDFDHNKLIAQVAKQTLLTAGLKRKGKSRLYYDDNGWWCTIISFQPSGFSKGSYLNVGVSWLLYEQEFFSFDVECGKVGFSSAENEKEFTNAIFEMAIKAKTIAGNNRERFSKVPQAHDYYQSIKRTGWDFYYAGVIAGMNHQFDVAKENFNLLLSYPETCEWEKILNSRVRELVRLMEYPNEFGKAVIGIVLKARALLRLENRERFQLGLPSVEDF